MTKFHYKILLFLLPLLLFLVAVEYYFYSLRETMPIEEVAELQHSSPEETYYNRLFFGNNLAVFKRAAINEQKPDILILGQSIVLQLRDFMFHPLDDKVYNAGHIISNIDELEQVVEYMRTGELHRPKIILFGLDFALPKKNYWLDWRRRFDEEYPDAACDPNAHGLAIQKFLKFPTRNLASQLPPRYPSIGYGYMGQRGFGYRNDGSFLMSKRISDYITNPEFDDERNFKKAFDKRQVPFTLPSHFEKSKVIRIKKCLSAARAMGIEVIIFAAPLAKDFLDHCLADTAFVQLWGDFIRLQNEVAKIYPFFKLNIPQEIGLDDRFMLDSNHPGEVLMGLIFYKFLIENEGNLGYLNQVAPAYLRERLLDPKTIPLSFKIENPKLLEYWEGLKVSKPPSEGMELVRDAIENGMPVQDLYR